MNSAAIWRSNSKTAPSRSGCGEASTTPGTGRRLHVHHARYATESSPVSATEVAAARPAPGLHIARVIGVSHEAISRLFQSPIEPIEHDVGKQRTDHATLRCPDRGGFENSVFHHTGCQKFFDQIQDVAVKETSACTAATISLCGMLSKKPAMSASRVTPLACLMKRQQPLDRVMTAAAGPKPERAIVKQRLEDRLKKPSNHLLCDPISDSRDA